MTDEWKIKKDMHPPKNLNRAVKADMKRMFKRFTESSEFKSMSKKNQHQMLEALPAIVTMGYMISIIISAIQEYSKGNKKVRGRRK